MPTIRCTQKLLKQMGEDAPPRSSDDGPQESPLDWYANLLWIERRKCVLFTNAGSLYTFMVPDVRKEYLRRLPELFREHLKRNLEYEDFGNPAIEKVLERFRLLVIGKTRSRSVLGSMSDYAEQFQVYVHLEGGVRGCNILSINHKVSESPMSAIGYSSGIKEFKRSLIHAAT